MGLPAVCKNSCCVKFPTIYRTATGLVQLEPNEIPASGYISPEEMATPLAALKRLEFLPFPYIPIFSISGRRSRYKPTSSFAHTCRPSRGDGEYLEVIVSGIDAPILRCASLTSFIPPVFDTLLLRRFISRTAVLVTKLPQQAEIFFQNCRVDVTLLRKNSTGVERTLDAVLVRFPGLAAFATRATL